MQTHMPKLEVMLIVVLMAAWVGGWVAPVAGAKKPPRPPAPVPQTGQTMLFAPGDDGDIQAGVQWPVPRFTDLDNGTVRDNLTGLIWLKNANCFDVRSWAQALTAATNLASPSCDLSDGSVAGDWRLPNVKELFSLIDVGHFDPAFTRWSSVPQRCALDRLLVINHARGPLGHRVDRSPGRP